MNDQNVTIRDIAAAAKVSTGTVSRALKNQPGLSDSTRAEVLRVATELGYDLGNLRNNKIKRLLFVFNRQIGTAASNPFYSEILHGVEQACREEQVSLGLMSVEPGESVAETRNRHSPDALLVAGHITPEQVDALKALDLPLVLVDLFHEGCYCINDDNVTGAHLATSHLIQQGRQRVAMLTGPAHHSVALRIKGYRKALFDAHYLADPDYEVPVNLQTLSYEEASRKAMAQLLDLPQRPDSVFAYNDSVALYAMALCRERGLRIPEDIAFAGYDDIEASARSQPPLTTIRVDKQAMGYSAASALIEGNLSPGEDLLPVELLVRQSS